jgi:hypothetical protein
MLLVWAGAAWAAVRMGSQVATAELRRSDAKTTLTGNAVSR